MVGKEYKLRNKKGQFTSPRKIAIGVIIVGLFLLALMSLFYNTVRAFNEWSWNNKWWIDANPLEWQEGWKLWNVEPIERETIQPWVDGEEIVMDIDAVVEKADNPVILRGVHMLESTAGKNDGCLEDGLVNGFGYRQNTFEYVCYPDFRTVANKVDQWYTKRLAENGSNVAEALCFYNKGIAGMHTCDYSQNFLTVVGEYIK